MLPLFGSRVYGAPSRHKVLLLVVMGVDSVSSRGKVRISKKIKKSVITELLKHSYSQLGNVVPYKGLQSFQLSTDRLVL